MSKKYSVFLVDDDKFLLDMYKRKFENDGASVEVAVGAEEALTKLRTGTKPDVLVFDIIMPSMDGLELLKVVRKEKLTPDSAVVMLTNESDKKAIEEAKSLGINGYIVKATTIPSEVIEKIKQIAKI